MTKAALARSHATQRLLERRRQQEAERWAALPAAVQLATLRSRATGHGLPAMLADEGIATHSTVGTALVGGILSQQLGQDADHHRLGASYQAAHLDPEYVQLLGRLETGMSVDEVCVRAAKEPSPAPISDEMVPHVHGITTTALTPDFWQNSYTDVESEHSAAGGPGVRASQLVSVHEVAVTAGDQLCRPANALPAPSIGSLTPQDIPAGSSATGGLRTEVPRTGGAMLDDLIVMQRSLTLEDLHSLRHALLREKEDNTRWARG